MQGFVVSDQKFLDEISEKTSKQFFGIVNILEAFRQIAQPILQRAQMQKKLVRLAGKLQQVQMLLLVLLAVL